MGVRHHWIRHLVKDFETNPTFQYHFHLVMMAFWILNAIVGTIIMILAPHLWLQVGVYYVFILSIYANWDTDYDAVSASLAAKHSKALLDRDTRASSSDDKVES